jgi:hypothetical protein
MQRARSTELMMAKKLSIGSLATTIDAEPKYWFKYGARVEGMRIFYEAGIMLALYDALILTRDSGRPAPEWVIEGALSIIGPLLKAGITTGKGASANTAAKYKTDMRHFCRWLVVRALHKEGTDGSLYKKAEKLLENKFGWGSAAVIGKSFRRVEKHLKNPKVALRYYKGLTEGQKLMATQFPRSYKVKPDSLTHISGHVVGSSKSAGHEPDG